MSSSVGEQPVCACIPAVQNGLITLIFRIIDMLQAKCYKVGELNTHTDRRKK